MSVKIGEETIEITEDTCQTVLRGKMMPMGCLINAKTKAYKKNGLVSVFPLRARMYPILVEDEKLTDLTTDAGKWENVYTYVIKR